MSTLSVLRFSDETSAESVLDTLKRLQSQNLITVEDAAIATRKLDGKIKIKHANDLVGAGALGGAFWGLLFGLIFFIPVIGAAVGAGLGALAGTFSNLGIDENFIKNVANSVQPGQSALFLLTSGAVIDKVADALKAYQFQLIQTSLSKEDENKLRETFGLAPVSA